MPHIWFSLADMISVILFVDIDAIYAGSSHVLSNKYKLVLAFHWFSFILSLVQLTSGEETTKLFGNHFKYVVANAVFFWLLLQVCFTTCSTSIATYFFIMAKFCPAVCINFFNLLKPVLYNVASTISLEHNHELVRLREKALRLSRLIKLSFRLILIFMSLWESMALYNMYVRNELFVYDVFWAIRNFVYAGFMATTWNAFLFLFIIGCDLFALKCRMLSYWISQAEYDTAYILIAYNTLICRIKMFDKVTKYVLAIFDICLLPTLGITINQSLDNEFNIVVKLIIFLGLLLVLSALLALYLVATITNSSFNQIQLIFAKRIISMLPHLEQIRVTHTESYKLSYLICRIFKNNPLGMTLVNLTVITKMKLFKTVIQVSRYCILGYKMKRLFDK